jgi:glycosyltransferase involved in cell wall biosynthesis
VSEAPTARLRVAIVITRLDLGGAQEVALETAAGLDPARFDVTLYAGAGGDLDEEARRRLGSRFETLPQLVHPIRPHKDLLALLWLAWRFWRDGVRVVHTHSSKAGLLGRLAAWIARVPRVVHTVHGWSFNDFQSGLTFKAFVLLERALAPLTDVLAVVATSLRDKGLLQGIGQAHQYALLRAGVDLPAWRKTPRSRRALQALVPKLKPKVVGVIANLKPQKAPLDFVRVAAAVCERRKDVDFIYVGDGPLRAEAQALAEELSVAKRVHLLGWQRDPRQLAAGFDVFLLPSLFEGLPCVYPQALSLGLPVVGTQVDGAAEIVREGVNGYLCQPRDIGALAERVEALLEDSGLRKRMSVAAKRSAGPEFSYGDMVARTAALYEGRT